MPQKSTSAIRCSIAPPVHQNASIGGRKAELSIATIAPRCSATEIMATIATLITVPTKKADSAPMFWPIISVGPTAHAAPAAADCAKNMRCQKWMLAGPGLARLKAMTSMQPRIWHTSKATIQALTAQAGNIGHNTPPTTKVLTTIKKMLSGLRLYAAYKSLVSTERSCNSVSVMSRIRVPKCLDLG